MLNRLFYFCGACMFGTVAFAMLIEPRPDEIDEDLEKNDGEIPGITKYLDRFRTIGERFGTQKDDQ